jgi:thiamine-phosphate pyrophosphorylase
VGAENKTPEEGERRSLAHVATASWRRVQQALRVIEETLKLSNPAAAAAVEKLRYQAYTLDKACRTSADSQARLAGARLYVLLAGGNSECAFAERAQQLIAAGVHMIQLRDKRLDDRTLLARARLLRRVIDEHQMAARQEPHPPTTHHSPLTTRLFILNDRPDLAVLSRADGVHVGQDELSVHDVRQIAGPEMLIGVSTHSIEQARQAVLDGANYIGCGPTFPSATKEFDQFPGLAFLRQVAAETSLPAFAIGGITLENLPQVLSTGMKRIAVGGASAEAEQLHQLLLNQF